jgi:predicted nucleic acid-binding protein
MGALALDTSVIIPALLSWHEHHAAALPVVQAAFEGSEAPILPLPVLVEAFAVLTRLPPPWRVSSSDAHALLARTFRARARVVGIDGQEAWELLDAALASGVAGGATYDAHIAACARKAGASRLVTFNRKDFERLGIDLLVL